MKVSFTLSEFKSFLERMSGNKAYVYVTLGDFDKSLCLRAKVKSNVDLINVILGLPRVFWISLDSIEQKEDERIMTAECKTLYTFLDTLERTVKELDEMAKDCISKLRSLVLEKKEEVK
jgi:hypothetical protein